MVGTWALFWRDCLPVYKSFVRTENFKEGQGIHVALDFFFSSCYIKVLWRNHFSLFIACIELHKNLSVTAWNDPGDARECPRPAQLSCSFRARGRLARAAVNRCPGKAESISDDRPHRIFKKEFTMRSILPFETGPSKRKPSGFPKIFEMVVCLPRWGER